MLYYYDLDISEVFIHENFLINQIKEGKHIEPKHTEILQNVIDKHFSKRHLIYISNRINSYSVNPLSYTLAASIENLVAIAIVAITEEGKKAARFEKDFYSKPFSIFSSLTEAIAWTHKELERATESAN